MVEGRAAVDESFRTVVEEMRLSWERSAGALHFPVTEDEVQRSWLRLLSTIESTSESEARLRSRLTSSRRWGRWAVAASVLLALGVGVWRMQGGAAPWSGASGELAARPTRTVTAPAGERLSLTLREGSRVMLAPGSRLEIPGRLDGDTREVVLAGRAYFEVAPDASRPFFVRASGVVTRVLGTEFDVRAYPGTSTQVVVRSGRVAVRTASAPESSARVLRPGDRGTVGASGPIQVESGLDVNEILGWTTGALTFRDTPFREVVPELERWYRVRIELADTTLANRRVTASFRDQPIDVVTVILAKVLGANVEQTDRQVVFSAAHPER
jgi:transmembrane sensor